WHTSDPDLTITGLVDVIVKAEGKPHGGDGRAPFAQEGDTVRQRRIKRRALPSDVCDRQQEITGEENEHIGPVNDCRDQEFEKMNHSIARKSDEKQVKSAATV